MFLALETLPAQEAEIRAQKVQKYMQELKPECRSMFIFSRPNIYYLTGHWASGVLWVPADGEPVLFCRKGIERARMESPLRNIFSFRSYSQLQPQLQEMGVEIGTDIGVEKNGLSWSMSEMFMGRMPGLEMHGLDFALTLARSVKTEWEINKMSLAGRRHHQALYENLPALIHPGMSEREISLKIWQSFFELGHQGMMRMQAHGEEIFLGHVSAGDSGNYPSVFNGPLGLRGQHPCITQMGYAGKIWQKNEPLAADCGFMLEGYHTDKTQIYWGAGENIPAVAQKAHDVCIEIQNTLAEQLVPGAIPSELFTLALDIAGKHGQQEGFMGLGANKVNFVGHGIGLAVDEFPAIAKGFDRPLQANMVLALEPKIGLSGLGMVGVENTFLVTEAGGKSLTGANFNIVPVE